MNSPRPAASLGHPYHHGALRRVLLDAALAVIGEDGPAALNLRALARRIGVSHAAPTHHFVDKAALLTAIAVEGYDLLAESLRAAEERTGYFLEMGVAYVHFAVTHPAHFAVMYRPELYHADDPAVETARAATAKLLYGPARRLSDNPAVNPLQVGVAAWALVHGLAMLYLGGNLPPQLGDDPDQIAREIAAYLFRALP
ncbi:MAG TPA: TetR/AcrR family transcriptional regulator [Chloroflexota bacterium]|nr:TetR/AcrR family transcriptional regulator [Chloroflexota bacterium]